MSGIWIMTALGWREFHKECPNSNKIEGAYRPGNPEIGALVMAGRTERFCHALADFHPVHNASQFRGDHFIEPLYGAFGEKL